MLEINWVTDEPAAATDRLLAIPIVLDYDRAEVEARFGAGIVEALDAAKFKGKGGDAFDFTRERSGMFERVAFFGIGEALELPDAMRQLAHDATRKAGALGLGAVALDLRWSQAGEMPWSKPDANAVDAAHAGNLFAQGLELGTYAYERFLSEDKRKPSSVARVDVWSTSPAAGEGVRAGQIIAAAVVRARDLGNGPAGLVTPTFLAQAAQEIVDAAKGADVSLTVLERADCEARNMGCYLGVAKGSDEAPKFIHLQYKPSGKAKGRVALIGKGVTFDSGGYSLKPTDGMLDMKLDMAGSAAVIGAFEGLVALEVPYEVHVVVAATENMVSGHAYRLGDVLVASNGKSVEINNTDAEGRLTLADAMVYAAALEPDYMIDFATLTGACIVALGPKIAGVMTTDDALYAQWMAAAAKSGETMWRLPLPADLKEQLQSKIADMKNTGERWGGALTAGLFLSEFTEGKRWMHVDIAGPAMVSKPHGITTAGGSGFAVATILQMLRS